MVVKCKKYPELHISDLGVSFIKGVAEVSDAGVLSKLQGMDGFDFKFEADFPAVKPSKPPKEESKTPRGKPKPETPPPQDDELLPDPDPETDPAE